MRAQPSDEWPVFRADYLILQPPNHQMALHRVASGLFIEDALASALHFQTVEYVQLSNPDIGGLWGLFELKPNPHFTPGNPKMGTKFTRHNAVTREHIRLHNVRVL